MINGRNRRKGSRTRENEEISIKKILSVAAILLATGIIAFIITVKIYNNSLEEIYDDLDSKEIAYLTTIKNGNRNIVEETSASFGRTVDEMKNEIEHTSVENEEVAEIKAKANQKKETNVKEQVEKIENTEKPVQEKKEEKIAKEEPKTKELSFEYPVKGEIIKEFAKDTLIYSDTLKEWVTHAGIDIKADKTTVVKAAEEGTVTAIKNDPRYGITVIIEHANGFETRYANLLTAEFVTVGEKVSKGQTIGTVGNTAAFEITDDYHLHFELLKDKEYQNPSALLK